MAARLFGGGFSPTGAMEGLDSLELLFLLFLVPFGLGGSPDLRATPTGAAASSFRVEDIFSLLLLAPVARASVVVTDELLLLLLILLFDSVTRPSSSD